MIIDRPATLEVAAPAGCRTPWRSLSRIPLKPSGARSAVSQREQAVHGMFPDSRSGTRPCLGDLVGQTAKFWETRCRPRGSPGLPSLGCARASSASAPLRSTNKRRRVVSGGAAAVFRAATPDCSSSNSTAADPSFRQAGVRYLPHPATSTISRSEMLTGSNDPDRHTVRNSRR